MVWVDEQAGEETIAVASRRKAVPWKDAQAQTSRLDLQKLQRNRTRKSRSRMCSRPILVRPPPRPSRNAATAGAAALAFKYMGKLWTRVS